MSFRLVSLTKKFGNNLIVDEVSLTVETGEMFFLLGPSGCGKTTILRLLAGFYPPDSGTIHIGSRAMNGVPPQQRNTALVFQQYALWPHLTVFENVAYGLRVRKVAAAERQARTDEALRQVRLESLAQRKPAQLSGGQQQRVALARALVVRPELLLFDEPLSNLDAKLRLEMRDEIHRLHRQEPRTSLYVTHDQEEAFSLATRLGVMNKGKIEQVGTPREVYDQPATAFVAGFMGEINLFDPASPWAKNFAAQWPATVAAPRWVGFRPQHVVLGSEGPTATVLRCTYLGGKSELVLASEGSEFKAWTPEPLAVGRQVRFQIARWYAFAA